MRFGLRGLHAILRWSIEGRQLGASVSEGSLEEFGLVLLPKGLFACIVYIHIYTHVYMHTCTCICITIRVCVLPGNSTHGLPSDWPHAVR